MDFYVLTKIANKILEGRVVEHRGEPWETRIVPVGHRDAGIVPVEKQLKRKGLLRNSLKWLAAGGLVGAGAFGFHTWRKRSNEKLLTKALKYGVPAALGLGALGLGYLGLKALTSKRED